MNEVLPRIALVLMVSAAIVPLGCGSGEDSADAERDDGNVAAERRALASYQEYLDKEAALLVRWTGQLRDRIAAGDQFGATFRYATARVHYGHLQPAARLFPRLNARIDGPTGLRRIERILYGRETTRGLKPVAASVVADAEQLRRELAGAELRPAAIAHANGQLMGEISGEMMGSRDEPYSRFDHIDISAVVEGSEAGFLAVRPLLVGEEPDLVRETEERFAEAFERIAEHGAPARLSEGPEAGTFFVPYQQMNAREIRELAEPLDALTQLLGEASDRLRGT
jgi:iron uptake system component EfeO